MKRTRLERFRRGIERLWKRVVGSPQARAARAWRLLVPLLVAVVPLYWVVDATYRATLTTIGRDQGIFQYIAWAVGQGDVDYRDVRDVNGPLIHMLHRVGLWLGSTDEHRFHVLDVTATGLSFAFVGALLPSAVTKRPIRFSERAAWALATWVVLAAQYALFSHWNQAQRESLADWFLLPSLAIQIAGVRGLRRQDRNERAAFWHVAVVIALSTITWFGKTSFVFLTMAQLGVFWIDKELPLSRRARLSAFFVGGALGVLPPLLYLLRYGDVLAYVRLSLYDVPQVYRFIWARTAYEILGDPGPLSSATFGIAVAGLLSACVFVGWLPRRVYALALAPVASLASAIAQHKGFDYHFHPLNASAHVGVLVLLALLGTWLLRTPRSRRVARFAILASATSYALVVAAAMRESPHTRNVWLLAGGETAERRNEKAYFDSFATYDFFPWSIRQGARYLTDTLSENARVQVYGMDPYILFLAQRRSATPYIYAYELNATAALEGGWSNVPDDRQSERIRAWRDEHERDMLARLREAPPEAFVFIDHAPLTTWQEAWEDFRFCCKDSAKWVAERYHPARSFEQVHVWLRDDLPVSDAVTFP